MKVNKIIRMLKYLDQNVEVGEMKITVGTIELNLKDLAEISKSENDTKEFDRQHLQRT